MSFILGMSFLLMHCSGARDIDRGNPSHYADESGIHDYQAPARKYAGEVLSYLMQVVVGSAGDPAIRQAWLEFHANDLHHREIIITLELFRLADYC